MPISKRVDPKTMAFLIFLTHVKTACMIILPSNYLCVCVCIVNRFTQLFLFCVPILKISGHTFYQIWTLKESTHTHILVMIQVLENLWANRKWYGLPNMETTVQSALHLHEFYTICFAQSLAAKLSNGDELPFTVLQRKMGWFYLQSDYSRTRHI